MFGIGLPELIIILAIALVVLGPQKLPELARTLGKGLHEFKRASHDFRRSIEAQAVTAAEAGPAGHEDTAAEAAETHTRIETVAGKIVEPA